MHPDEFRLVPAEAEATYLRFVTEFFDASRNSQSSYFGNLQKWYDCWRNAIATKGSPGWNNIGLPLIFSLVESRAAKKCEMHFGGSPILTFSGAPEYEDEDRRLEKLIEMQLNDCNTFTKAVRFHKNADLFGQSVWGYSWKKVYGSTLRRQNSILGEQRVAATNPITGSASLRFNGPDWQQYANEDFFPDPGVIDVKDMRGVVLRSYEEFEDIVANSEPGPNGEMPVYDPAVVARMSASGPNPAMAEERAWRTSMARYGADTTWSSMSDFSKPVEVLRYWGRVPRSMAVADPAAPGSEPFTEVMITVADRAHVLSVVPIPFWNREVPFGVYRPFEDPYHYHAPGMVELCYKLQVAANRLANTKLDILDMFVSPPWLFDSNVIDPRRLRIGPNAVIPVDGPVGQEQLRQLVPDLRGTQMSYGEIEALWNNMQRATGTAEDISLGMGASDRQTRAEVLTRAAAVTGRLKLEVRLAELNWLEPVGDAFVAMNDQFLPHAQEIAMLGSASIYDPVTMHVVPADEDPASYVPVMRLRKAKATAATRAIQKDIKWQQYMQMIQLSGSVPMVAASMNWVAVIREMWGLLDHPNVDRVMNTEEQMLRMTQIALAMGGLGASDGQAKGSGVSGMAPAQAMPGEAALGLM